MNNKGQALIEFVIILPIFLLLIIAVIDFGTIITKKYSLENDLDTVSELYLKGENSKADSFAKNNGFIINYTSDIDFINIEVVKSIKITSPMLQIVFGKSYNINSKRSLYKEFYE